MLIASPENENEEQFRTWVTDLLVTIYGRLPDWVQFCIGRRFKWHDVLFREFLCPAGSVSAFIEQYACKNGGISRSIILRGEQNGRSYCCEIHFEKRIDFECSELLQL
jgi:hypothetical protein